MPFPELTPYEVLDVSPGAGLKEIMTAYQKAVKEKRYPPARLAQAFNELKNTRKRGEYDLFTISNLGDGAAVRHELDNLPPFPFVSPEVSPIPINHAQTARDIAAVEKNEKPIPDLPFTYAIPPAFQTLTIVLAPIPFPA